MDEIFVCWLRSDVLDNASGRSYSARGELRYNNASECSWSFRGGAT